MRIVIAEDSVLLRAGLVQLWPAPGSRVVAEVTDVEGLVRAVEQYRPDLALVDVRMPPTFTDEGVRAALDLKKRRPQIAVLLLSQYVEENYAAELLAGHIGGLGYLLRTGSPTWTSTGCGSCWASRSSTTTVPPTAPASGSSTSTPSRNGPAA